MVSRFILSLTKGTMRVIKIGPLAFGLSFSNLNVANNAVDELRVTVLNKIQQSGIAANYCTTPPTSGLSHRIRMAHVIHHIFCATTKISKLWNATVLSSRDRDYDRIQNQRNNL
jgi:hypothetical protein